MHTLSSLYASVSNIVALFCAADCWLFCFIREIPHIARMTMVHRNVNARAFVPIVVLAFFVAQKVVRLLEYIIL